MMYTSGFALRATAATCRVAAGSAIAMTSTLAAAMPAYSAPPLVGASEDDMLAPFLFAADRVGIHLDYEIRDGGDRGARAHVLR